MGDRIALRRRPAGAAVSLRPVCSPAAGRRRGLTAPGGPLTPPGERSLARTPVRRPRRTRRHPARACCT